MVNRARQVQIDNAAKRKRKSRMVSAPVARAKAPGPSSRYPAVPFTGTERLVSIAPTAADGASFIRSFDWNPGLASTFSAGHFQAQNFDKYTLLAGNAIRYTPACSTLTSGSVYILIDYDPNDPAPTTEIEFADNELNKTCALHSTVTAPIDLGQTDNCKLIIRTGPSSTDKLFTDPCVIHIGAFGYGTSAVAEGLVLGHLHIDYRAKLHVRQPAPSGPAPPRNVLSLSYASAEIPSGVTLLAPQLTPIFNTLPAVVEGGSIFLPPGAYDIHCRIGLTIPTQPGIVFIRMKFQLEGIDVPQSQSDFNEIPADTRQVQLQSDRIIVVRQNQSLRILIDHDHGSTVRISNSRSLFTARLL